MCVCKFLYDVLQSSGFFWQCEIKQKLFFLFYFAIENPNSTVDRLHGVDNF